MREGMSRRVGWGQSSSCERAVESMLRATTWATSKARQVISARRMGLWVEGVTGGVMGSCGEKFVMAGVVGDAHCRRRLVNAPEQALRLAVALMWRTRARDASRRRSPDRSHDNRTRRPTRPHDREPPRRTVPLGLAHPPGNTRAQRSPPAHGIPRISAPAHSARHLGSPPRPAAEMPCAERYNPWENCASLVTWLGGYISGKSGCHDLCRLSAGAPA